MNDSQFKKLAAHARQARSLAEQISDIVAMLRGIKRRKKDGAKMFQISVQAKSGSGYDRGCWGTVSLETIDRAIVPAMKTVLAELRQKLKDLPATPD